MVCRIQKGANPLSLFSFSNKSAEKRFLSLHQHKIAGRVRWCKRKYLWGGWCLGPVRGLSCGWEELGSA